MKLSRSVGSLRSTGREMPKRVEVGCSEIRAGAVDEKGDDQRPQVLGKRSLRRGEMVVLFLSWVVLGGIAL